MRSYVWLKPVALYTSVVQKTSTLPFHLCYIHRTVTCSAPIFQDPALHLHSVRIYDNSSVDNNYNQLYVRVHLDIQSLFQQFCEKAVDTLIGRIYTHFQIYQVIPFACGYFSNFPEGCHISLHILALSKAPSTSKNTTRANFLNCIAFSISLTAGWRTVFVNLPDLIF